MITPVYDTIVSFGCWNQTHTKDGPSDEIKKVMMKLKETGKDVVLVSGDNYYPVKTSIKTKAGKEKIKQVNLDELKEGFEYLKDATQGTPVYMNFGNHDVVSNDQVTTNSEKECIILETELEEGNEKFHVGMNHKLNYGTHTLILMIDTSIYSKEKEFKKFNKCYNLLTKLSQAELIKEQERFVKTSVEEFQGDNVIIVGHYPIFYEKEKKMSPEKQDNWFKPEMKEQTKRLSVLENSVDFTNLLFELPEKNYYYLCADYHLFEEGDVIIKKDGKERIIHQYISGTGGTELDPYTKKHATVTEKQKDYTIEYNHKSMKLQHGFLKGTFNDVWSFSFVPGYKTRPRRSRHRRSKSSKPSQSTHINLENVSKMNYSRSRRSKSRRSKSRRSRSKK
jgi:Icc-related predicted phosphoesterase